MINKSVNYTEEYGANALIVGASATIGEQFARQLAAKGMNVYLVARNENKLRKIADDIHAQYKVEVNIIALDLMKDGGIDGLFERTVSIDIHYLVVNANLHKINDFNILPLATKLNMMDMNIKMLTLLCDHYGPKMTSIGKGAILLISAMNCFMAIEKEAIFQASKAYLSLFAESLYLEYKRKGVHVAAALVNGIEGSDSYEAKTSSLSRKIIHAVGMSMKPAQIVASTLSNMEKKEG